MKPLDTRYASGTQVIASRPRFAPATGRSAVRFQSRVALRVESDVLLSNRSTLRRLTVLFVLSRSVDTYKPVLPKAALVTPSESGPPVPVVYVSVLPAAQPLAVSETQFVPSNSKRYNLEGPFCTPHKTGGVAPCAGS